MEALSLGDLSFDTANHEGTTLITTFYFYNDIPNGDAAAHDYFHKLEEYIINFVKEFNIEMVREEKINGWMIENYESFHYFFIKFVEEINGLKDTSAILIGATTYVEVNTGWPTLKKNMEVLLLKWKTYILDSVGRQPWKFLGYTMLYKANLGISSPYKDKSIRVIEKFAEALYSETKMQTIASQKLENGAIYLTNLPANVGFQTPLAYILLSEPGNSENLINDLFFKNHGKMLSINGYVLKSLYEWSQLKTKTYKNFSADLFSLSNIATKLVDNVVKRQSDSEVFNVLKIVSSQYNKMLSDHSLHQRLFLSINIQHQNFVERTLSISKSLNGENEIFSTLESRLRIQNAESVSLDNRAKIIFRQVQNAISLSESLNTAVEAQRSYRVQLILTLAGIGLAFIQIFDNECAVGLLKSTGITNVHVLDNEVAWWIKLLTKLIVGGLVLLTTFLIMRPKVSITSTDGNH